MNAVHEMMLKDFLRDVWTYGSDRLSYRLINRWFECERITKRVWLAFESYFEGIREEEKDQQGYRLGYLDTNRADFITFIVLDPEGSKSSYMMPLMEKT